jgi:hypothetical protein
MYRIRIVLVFCSFCLTVANGQSPQGPSEQVKRFAPYAGKFEGQLMMTEGGKTVTAKVQDKNSMISDDWGFLVEEVATMPDGGQYKSHNVMGYDAGGKKVHIFSVTNAGETHDHKGDWKDAKTLVTQYNGTWEGNSYVETITITFHNPDSYSVSWVATKGGKAVNTGEETLHRTP